MKIFETLLDVVLVPVEVIKDVFSFGMEAEETGASFTRKRLQKIDEDIKDE